MDIARASRKFPSGWAFPQVTSAPQVMRLLMLSKMFKINALATVGTGLRAANVAISETTVQTRFRMRGETGGLRTLWKSKRCSSES